MLKLTTLLRQAEKDYYYFQSESLKSDQTDPKDIPKNTKWKSVDLAHHLACHHGREGDSV